MSKNRRAGLDSTDVIYCLAILGIIVFLFMAPGLFPAE